MVSLMTPDLPLASAASQHFLQPRGSWGFLGGGGDVRGERGRKR